MKSYHLIGVWPFLIVSAYIIIFNFLWRAAAAKLSPSKQGAAMGALA